MAGEFTTLFTPKLQLPYLGSDGPVTHTMETKRYITLDVQIDALYAVLGNGIVSGLTVSTTPPAVNGVVPPPEPLTVFIAPGKAHVNNMACETISYTKISGLADGNSANPGRNYIYATTNADTPMTKLPVFYVSQVPLNQDNMIAIATVTIINTNQVTIDTSDRVEVGFVAVLLSSLLAHRHGKDGIPAIDLATEVKGFLDSFHIGDIPAERITSGIIDPKRFAINHMSLLNAGTLSHEDIDSIIEKLQKPNQKLFGDISATNLMQLIIAVKETLNSCDRFFRNLIIVIPGVDNITFDNTLTFLDPASAWEVEQYKSDDNEYTSSTGDLVVYNTDAAIIDYHNKWITGVESEGTTIHEVSIDTATEFLRGEFDPLHVKVDSIKSLYGYGYGYGYGEGLDYFDVFGLASMTTDQYGAQIHIGYGVNGFEAAYSGQYGYGFGYEYIPGGAFLPGHASVTLIEGNANVVLFSKDNGDEVDIPDGVAQPFQQSEAWRDIVNSEVNIHTATPTTPNTTPPKETMMERFYYNFPGGVPGGAGSGTISNSRLIYLLDTSDTTKQKTWDWSVYQNMFIRLKATDGDSSITITGTWYLQLVSSTLSGDESTSPYQLFGGLSKIEQTTFTESIDINALASTNANFNKAKIKKILIYSPDTMVPTPIDPENPSAGFHTEANTWDNNLDLITLSGGQLYSTFDEDNTIDKLFIVIPANPAAKLESISWVAEEPGDSRVRIFIKSVDANNKSEDGFALLQSATFGNAYMNKARGSETARPSGSEVSEANGTHIEIRAILDPSLDGYNVPVLHSITLRYSTVGGEETILFDTDEDYGLTIVDNRQQSNVELNENSQLILSNYSDVGTRRYGSTALFAELRFIGSRYQQLTLPDSAGNRLPRTQLEYTEDTALSSYSYVSAVKKTSDGNYIIADALNNRIVLVDGTTNEFKWGFYGHNCLNEGAFRPIFAHYNSNTGVLYVSFSHFVEPSSIQLGGWRIKDVVNNVQLNPNADGPVQIISSNNLGYRTPQGSLVSIKLSESTKFRLRGLTIPWVIAIDNTSVATTQTPDIALNFTKTVEVFNIYYGNVSCPIDIKLDSDDNLLIAQVRDDNSANDTDPIIKISMTNPLQPLYSFRNIGGKELKFNRNYLGSVEEAVDSSGNVVILAADCDNQRVVQFDSATGNVLWTADTSNVIPQNTYPTCATLGGNGKFYIALTDKLAGDDSKIIEVDNGFRVTKEILRGTVSNPRDVYYLSRQKLLISS